MNLATQNRRSLLSLALLGVMAAVGTTQGTRASALDAAAMPMAACEVRVESVPVSSEDSQAQKQPAPARRIDWRSMLPAVTLGTFTR
jgi:hypothetical protein